MRSGKSIAAFALLALAAGCSRKPATNAALSTAQAPPLPPAQMAALLSPLPPPIPVVTERPIKLDTNVPPETTAKAAPAAPKRVLKHHPKATPETAQQEQPAHTAAPPPPAPDTAPDTAPPNPEVASGQPSENSPIGQLSTTNDNADTADRHYISDQIDSTENGVNGIKRTLSSEEQKTVAQIRTFITRARDALKADDLIGARTLSTKAKLLLEELTKE